MSDQPKAGSMRIEGCITAGVEAGCLMLVTPDKKEFSLKGKNLPTLGSGLAAWVEGKVFDGVDICQQGTPFSVNSWGWTRMKCPK